MRYVSGVALEEWPEKRRCHSGESRIVSGCVRGRREICFWCWSRRRGAGCNRCRG